MGLLPLENGLIIKLKKTKWILKLNSIKIRNTKKILGYFSRERYHCPITTINIVRTKGKAGYLVWKLAGGQGDQDINLLWVSFGLTFFFDFLETKLFVANPLLIIQIKIS